MVAAQLCHLKVTAARSRINRATTPARDLSFKPLVKREVAYSANTASILPFKV